MSSKIRPVLVPIMDVPKSEVKGEEITEVIVKYKNKYNNLKKSIFNKNKYN